MNHWDTRYNQDDYVYGKEPNEFLKAHVDVFPAGTILCLGEGEGRNAVYLAQLGYDVLAVDSSAIGLQKAEKLAQEKGVKINTLVADLAEFDPGENVFSGAISIFCQFPPQIRAKVHAMAVRALQPGGVFLLENYTPEQLHYKTGGPPDITWLVNTSTIQQDFAALQHNFLQETVVDRIEGLGHSGQAAVVQFIGEKR